MYTLKKVGFITAFLKQNITIFFIIILQVNAQKKPKISKKATKQSTLISSVSKYWIFNQVTHNKYGWLLNSTKVQYWVALVLI